MLSINGNGLIRKMKTKVTSSGLCICEIYVSYRTTYRPKGADQYEYGFVKCTAIGKLGELYEKHFKKGDVISIEGAELRTNEFTPAGSDRKVSEQVVILNQLGFVPRPDKNKSSAKEEMKVGYTSDNASF